MSYLTDTLYLVKVARPKISIAEDGFLLENIGSGIKNYVLSQWDGNHPIASVLNFIGPGLLYGIAPWMGIVWELTEALGFDWRGLIETVGQAITDLFSHNSNPSQEEIHSKVSSTIEANFDNHFSKEPDEDKVKQLAQQLSPLLGSTASQDLQFIKQAGFFGFISRAFSRPLGGFWKKVLGVIITSAVLAVAGGAARGAVGNTKGIPSSDDETSPNNNSSSENSNSISFAPPPIKSLKLNPNLPSELTDFHSNDATSFWLEQGDLSQLPEYLKTWILQAFPQLSSQIDQIVNSPGFSQVENMFQAANKYSQGTGMFTVPRAFQRLLDIVSYIINKFLASQGH